MYSCICVFVQSSFCTKAIFEIWFPLVLAFGRPGRLELLSDWSYARSGRFIQHPLHGKLPNNSGPRQSCARQSCARQSCARQSSARQSCARQFWCQTIFRCQKIWCKKILVSDNSRAGHFWCQTIFLSGETQIRNWMIGVALHRIYIYPVCPVRGVAKNIPMSTVMCLYVEKRWLSILSDLLFQEAPKISPGSILSGVRRPWYLASLSGSTSGARFLGPDSQYLWLWLCPWQEMKLLLVNKHLPWSDF